VSTLVKEVTIDMARNMGLAARESFPNCTLVIDRFHVIKLVMDALQHIRVSFRWKAIAQENTAYKLAKERGGKRRKVLSTSASKRRHFKRIISKEQVPVIQVRRRLDY